MIDVLVLAIWMSVGAMAAFLLADRTSSRWGHVPMGMILGPLWIAVALDKRATE